MFPAFYFSLKHKFIPMHIDTEALGTPIQITSFECWIAGDPYQITLLNLFETCKNNH